MRHNKFICAVTALALTLGICGSVMPFSPTVYAAGNTVRLDPSEASPFNDGKFEGWGTALCWWANRIGYDETLTQQAADAFFSDEGLGLDIARYNIGGGDDPTHNHINRSDSKVPGYWGSYTASTDGKDVTITYDWTKDENQRNVAKAALAANPDLYFEGFSNSAPYFMTNSGCTSGGDPASADNLKADMYDDFAKYIAETTKHFKDEFGIEFKSYSPMNEPDTAYWGVNSDKQEGCHFDPGTSQSNMIIETRKALDAAGLTDVLVAGMDETDINKSVTNFGKLTDEAKDALGRIDTHTYDGSNRAGLKQTAINAGKNLWQSEVDKGENGFWLAQRIIDDLNGMQASAWVIWDIIDSHKDATFEYPAGSGTHPEANRSLDVTGSLWGVGMADHDTKELKLANKYYAYGQFTKYINPGDTLIASSGSTLAAYNRETGDIKIVVNNSGSSDIPYTFDLSAFTTVGDTVKEIRSNNLTGDAAEHWKEITGEATLADKKLETTAKAGTITTYVISGAKGFDDKYAIITGGGSEINVNASVQLTLKTNIEGSVTWKVDDDKVASITDGGLLTANKSGTVTVSATVGDYTAARVFVIPAYKLSGTPSWGNDSNAPKDSDDYRKAADKDLTTYFDGTQNGYVMYDYGTPYKINKVQLAPREGYAARTVGGKVQGSNDAVTWTDLYTVAAALAEGQYTDVTTFANTNAYRYYRYTNPSDMTNISEFLIDGDYPTGITMYSATEKGLAYSYKLPEEYSGCDAYFAVHDGNRLKYASANQTSGSASGDFSNLAPKLYVWDNMKPMGIITDISNAVKDEPIVSDITGFTDNFEGSENIFGGKPGGLEDGKIVYASGLERFGNVFIPANTTASATLSSPITLGKNQLFRLQFNMFSGWEDGGKDNTFAIKDADGNEIVAFTINVGSSSMTSFNIGGINVLDGTPNAQCKSNTSGRTSANGWGHASQPYRNNMGYNKTVEILIDGGGSVTASLNGGTGDIAVSGVLDKPISIKSIELTGACNTARDRIVSYDNFNADVITYKDDFKDLTAEPTPEPTDAPVLPEDGTLISLDFDDGDLTSSSTYGKAEAVGTAKFATVDGKKALHLDNTNASAIKLTDANGNGLLAGQDEITVSFKFKQTADATSWWFYSAPNNNAQTFNSEHYIGALGKSGGTLSIERYHNGRSGTADGAFTLDAWHDVIISFGEAETSLYIDGTLKANVDSSFKISDMLGSNPVAYIGKANWVNGEFATGYIDDFKIVKGALKSALNDIDLGDLSAVKSNLTLPTNDGITWTSSNESVISTEGVVTRPDQTTTVKLTASVTENGVTFTRTFDVVVVGTKSSAYLFAHFVGNESSADHEQIYFSVSQTGTSWTTLNGGKPVLTSNVGEKGVRDPYILRGEGGKFYIIATDLSIYHNHDWGRAQSEGSQSIVVWESSDLVDWGDARLVKVAVDDAGCTWAPEAVYDSEEGKYMVFWASKTSDDNYTTQRMYRSYTSDFITFTKPEIYIDGGTVSNIDTTIVEEDGVYYRFTKNETKSSVTMMKSTSLDGPWTDVETYTINGTAGSDVTGYEGPTIYKNNDGGWTLLLDHYSAGDGYKPFVTDDLSKGVFKSAADFTFDATYRHGTVMPITQDEYDALIAKYRNS